MQIFAAPFYCWKFIGVITYEEERGLGSKVQLSPALAKTQRGTRQFRIKQWDPDLKCSKSWLENCKKAVSEKRVLKKLEAKHFINKPKKS